MARLGRYSPILFSFSKKKKDKTPVPPIVELASSDWVLTTAM